MAQRAAPANQERRRAQERKSDRRAPSRPAGATDAAMDTVPPVVHDGPTMLRLQRVAGNGAARNAVAGRGTFPIVVSRAPGPKVPAAGSLAFAGALLGTNSAGKPVKAVRELGSKQGYDGRVQAISVARMAKADPAAAVLGTDRRWHAFATDAQFETGAVAGAATAGPKAIVLEVHGIPSVSGIDGAKKAVDEHAAKIGRLDGLVHEWETDPEFRKAVKGATPPFKEAVAAERAKTVGLLDAAKVRRVSIVLGVPEAEVKLIRTISFGREATKVNVVEIPDSDSPGGGHNPMGADLHFKEGLHSALHIDLDQLDVPARAQAILFHEAQHRSDWDFAQLWITNYRAATQRQFVKGDPGRKPFEDWLNEQVKAKRLTPAQVELIVMETLDSSAYTEANANVRTFLTLLQVGDAAQAQKELVAYANNLKPKKEGGLGNYSAPAPRSQVQAGLVAELKAARSQMKPDMRQAYDAAVEAAIATYPGGWLTDLRFAPAPKAPARKVRAKKK